MTRLDCRGLSCPMLVVKTRKALSEISTGEKLLVVVDNAAARDNILRLAESQVCAASVKSEKGGVFIIEIVKGHEKSEMVCGTGVTQGTVLFVGSDTLGRGQDELGAILMNSMLGALAEIKPLPKSLVFMNTGVKLVVKGSPVLEKVKRLEELGVEILVCGTCLDYFHLKDKVAVGAVSNMFTIFETFLRAGSVVSL